MDSDDEFEWFYKAIDKVDPNTIMKQYTLPSIAGDDQTDNELSMTTSIAYNGDILLVINHISKLELTSTVSESDTSDNCGDDDTSDAMMETLLLELMNKPANEQQQLVVDKYEREHAEKLRQRALEQNSQRDSHRAAVAKALAAYQDIELEGEGEDEDDDEYEYDGDEDGGLIDAINVSSGVVLKNTSMDIDDDGPTCTHTQTHTQTHTRTKLTKSKAITNALLTKEDHEEEEEDLTAPCVGRTVDKSMMGMMGSWMATARLIPQHIIDKRGPMAFQQHMMLHMAIAQDEMSATPLPPEKLAPMPMPPVQPPVRK